MDIYKVKILTAYYENHFGYEYAASLSDDPILASKIDCQVVTADVFIFMKEKIIELEQECSQLRQRIEAAEKQEPLGSVTIARFRGSDSMINTDFYSAGDLPDGTYQCFAIPSIPAAEPKQEDNLMLIGEVHDTGAVWNKNGNPHQQSVGTKIYALLSPTEPKPECTHGPTVETYIIDSGNYFSSSGKE